MVLGLHRGAPSPRGGEGWGEGRYELQLKLRDPLTRLASLATLSPSGGGEGAVGRSAPQRRRPRQAIVDGFAQAVARDRHDGDARDAGAVELAQMGKQV